MSGRGYRSWLLAALFSVAGPIAAQSPGVPAGTAALSVSRRVTSDTVTVGDRFRSFVAIQAPPGARVTFRGFASSDSIQASDSVQAVLRADGMAAGVYSLVAWVTSAPLGAEATVEVLIPGAAGRLYRVPLRLPHVRSVLPPEGEIAPRPSKGLLSAGETGRRSLWWAAVAAIFAALGFCAWLVWRRLRRPLAELDPRSYALRQLEDLSVHGLPPAIPEGTFYAAASRVLREYLARTDLHLGAHLTSTELIAVMRRPGLAVSDVPALERLLQHADRVKFARLVPGSEEAKRFIRDLRSWITENPAPVPQREAAA